MSGYKYTQDDFDHIAKTREGVKTELHSNPNLADWQQEHLRGALVRLDKEEIEHFYSDGDSSGNDAAAAGS